MASNSDEQKPEEVKKAEATGGQTFDPTAEQKNSALNCPTCNGDGILSPQSTQVCQTCQGTGKA